MREQNEPILSLVNLSVKRSGKNIFDHINWQINKGENWAIVGEVGSGKTSLLETILGKHPIVNGEIKKHFLDKYKTSASDYINILDHVSFLSFKEDEGLINYSNYYYQQRYNSTEAEGTLKVYDYLLSISTAFSKDKLDYIIQLLDIENLISLELIKLSNGQTRKILLAKTLLKAPELLILDNPFIGLDVENRKALNDILNNLIGNSVQLILTAGHDEIPESITNILWLEDCKIKGVFKKKEYLLVRKPKLNNLPFEHKLPLASSPIQKKFKVAAEFKNLTIKYGDKTILNGLNWQILKGEKWALLGPNGSGKSTLLSLMNADNPQAYANDIVLFDRERGSGESIWDIKKDIGFISPELQLYFPKDILCGEAIETGFFDTMYERLHPEDERKKRIFDFLKFYCLQNLVENKFSEISTGEQRLILIIRALIKNPPLLILDEPFQGLDECYILKSQRLLNSLLTDSHTIIFISHYEHEIPSIVDKRFYLKKGLS